MTITCSAVYEKGVLRPLTPPDLKEGEQVEVIILAPRPADGPKTLTQALLEIAALPVEGGGDPLTSQEHDRALYGEKGAR